MLMANHKQKLKKLKISLDNMLKQKVLFSVKKLLINITYMKDKSYPKKANTS